MSNQNYNNDTTTTLIDQIDTLFNILDENSSNTNSEIASTSKTALISYDEDADVHRSPAPRPTKCFFSGCGRRGNGGNVTVDILNSVNNLTTNIINSATQAAAVIVPPIANNLENVAVAWINRGQTPQQPTVIPYTPQGGQLPPGQWVPPEGQVSSGQWVWEPSGGQQTPGQWVPPRGQPPPGQWVPPGGQVYPGPRMPSGSQQPPGQWVPPGGQVSPGQWMPPDGQQPPEQWAPQRDQPPPGKWVPPGDQQQPGQWIPPREEQPPVNPPSQGNWGKYPGSNQYPSQGYPPASGVNVQVNARDAATANVNLGYPSASPSPTRSTKTQNTSQIVSTPLTRSGSKNVPQSYSLDSDPSIQKCSQDINKILQDMNKCLDNIMIRLS